MTKYVSVSQHAITPEGAGTVAPGDTVDLDPAIAAPYITSRDLVLAPETPSPSKKESDK